MIDSREKTNVVVTADLLRRRYTGRLSAAKHGFNRNIQAQEMSAEEANRGSPLPIWGALAWG